MPRDKARDRGLRGYPGFFLALTLVVMIIVILTAQNLTAALLIIGLITNFLIISSQLTLLGDRHTAAESPADARDSVMVTPDPGLIASLKAGFEPGKRREAFTMATTAPPGAGAPAFPNIPETQAASGYPGAIDFGETNEGDEALALGHVDWSEAARDGVPVGNPFSTSRVASPQAAEPCIDDDAIAMFDGDELVTYQARSRNKPERVWAGIYRRKALMDRYVREELDERENTVWWGAHEV